MVGIGVVGAGYWGPNIIRNLASIDGFELIAVCDLDEKKLQKIKQLYSGILVTKDFEELLVNESIQAIAVCTSPSSHYELVKKALNAGKHVFCEKPFTLKSSEAIELTQLAEEKNLKLMIGHTFVYTPAVNKLKELVDSGELGEIFYIYIRRLNLGLFQKDTNVVWDLAPHDVSIILYLMKEKPVSITATGNSHIQKGVEDVAFLNLKFGNGTFCHIHDSWLDPLKIRETVVVGSKKMVMFNDAEPLEKIKVFEKSVNKPGPHTSFGEFNLSYNYGDVFIPKLKGEEPLKIELSHFLECINKDLHPKTNGEQGAMVVRVLEAATDSIKNNGKEVML